jgi:Fe-S-cluster-containing hydrogenase component 2
MEKTAVEFYESLSLELMPAPCMKCPAPCAGACPFGLPVRELLIRAHRLLRP